MSLNASNNHGRRYKKHKKKSKFFQNAKGFAKQGIFGRGTFIENDEYNYFISVLDSMKTPFEDMEMKVNMANNVFEHTKGREVYLASNQIVCKVMESLIGFIDSEQLEAYFAAFADSFRPICSDSFASHVLQKMVEIAFLRFINKDKIKNDTETQLAKENGDDGEPPPAKKVKTSNVAFDEEHYNFGTEFTQEHKENCGKFVIRVGKFMLNNLEDFVWDTCANHIIRTCLLCLSGIYVPKSFFDKITNIVEKDKKIYEVPSEWHDVCKEFAERLGMWPQFKDFPYKDCSSALLSVLCTTLNVIDKKMARKLEKRILMEALLEADSDEDEKLKKVDRDENSEGIQKLYNDATGDDSIQKIKPKLAKVFQHKSSIVLLETLITLSSSKLFTQIYAMLFINKLALLAKDPMTKFAVKKLVDHIREKEEFENVFEELQEHIEELLKIDHAVIITSLSSACLRLQTKQAQFIAALKSAVHLNENKDRMKSFFSCLLKLKPYEISQNDKTSFVHLHGSLLIQDLLHFNKPIFLVNCILETPADNLVTVFNTPNGSHICDHFLQSKFIGEKSRDKLLKHLEGFYSDLAKTKWGSRVVEACFASAQWPQKENIVKELANKINILKSTPFGEIINKKLRVDTYRLSLEQWKASFQRKESKVQELFKDVIN